MELPVRICLLLVGSFQVRHFHILLLFDSVDVFVQLVEQLGEKLGRIVLVVPHEHHVMLTEDFLEGARIDPAIAARLVPHVVVEPRQLSYHLAFGAQWIFQIDFLGEGHREQILPETFQV